MQTISYDTNQRHTLVRGDSDVRLYPHFLSAADAAEMAAAVTAGLGWQRLTGTRFEPAWV